MGFCTEQYVGDAAEVSLALQYTDESSDRERELAEAVKDELIGAAQKVGGYIHVSMSGSFNGSERLPGDNFNLQLSTSLKPSDPTPDAGLEAFGGSPRSFPPEAVTAAPATADGAPPADQQSLPETTEVALVAPAAPTVPTETESEDVSINAVPTEGSKDGGDQ